LAARVKNRLVAPGRRPRRILRGALKGVRMQLDLGHHAQVYLGTYEHEVQQLLPGLTLDAVTAVDVGAADGAYSLYFLARTAVRAVYAFEPDPAARDALLANLRLNDLDGDGRLRLSAAAAGAGGGANGIALDSLSPEIATPAVIKIDVEGHEADVLRGAGRLLERRGISWIVETHSTELERECTQILEDAGLAVRVVYPAWWRFALPERRPLPHNRWLVAPDAAQDVA
jgi:hypothetical protein